MTIPRKLPRWGLGVIFLVALSFTLLQARVPTTFNIVAQTESLQIRISEDHRSHWHLRDAEILYRPRTATGPAVLESEGFERFTGSVLVEPGTVVTFQRIASGPLEIHCFAGTAGGRVAALFDPGETFLRTFDDRVVFRLDGLSERTKQGQTIVLPLAERVTLGPELGEQIGPRPALLKGGKISMLGHSLMGRNRFDGGSVELDPGDSVTVVIDEADPGVGRSTPGGAPLRGPFYGLVIAGERSALTVVLRVVAKTATVSRFASQGYDVSVDVFNRVTRDPFTRTLWGVLGGLLAIAAFFLDPRDKEK